MTKDELRELLEDELLWRFEEINFFKKQLINLEEENEQRKYRKSMVLILYSHLEGFIKSALINYAQIIILGVLMKKNLLTLDVALSKEIKYMLKEEHYLPGDKLPSERKLAELFHVQRLTVRGALNLLLQDKTIISKPRSGYYVAPKRILQSIRNFSLHSEEDSGQLTYELYDFKKIEADNYLASEMLLPEKSKIYKIVWLYSDDTQLICINTTYIPEYIYPDLTQQIAASAPAIDLITNNCQITLAKSNQKVTLLYADTKTAQILNIPVDSPLMKYKGLMYDKQGHLAVFFENNMLIDRFGFIREVVL